MASVPRIDAERLIDFGAAVYASAGMPEADARFVADTLVQADLWGHQSHGVLRLGWYLERLQNKVMKPVTQPETVVDAGTIAVIDGHDGVGQVCSRRMRRAMRSSAQRRTASAPSVCATRIIS